MIATHVSSAKNKTLENTIENLIKLGGNMSKLCYAYRNNNQ